MTIGEIYWESFVRGNISDIITLPRVVVSLRFLHSCLITSSNSSIIYDHSNEHEELARQVIADFCDNDVFDPDPHNPHWRETHRLPRCWFSGISRPPEEMLWGKTLLEIFQAGLIFEGHIGHNSYVTAEFVRRYSGQLWESPLVPVFSKVLAKVFQIGEDDVVDTKLLFIRPCIWKKEASRLIATREQ